MYNRRMMLGVESCIYVASIDSIVIILSILDDSFHKVV